MSIPGTEGLSPAEIRQEIAAGGKFVSFSYCISILILTFKRSSQIYFVRANESAFEKGLKYTLISLLLGWWGLPFGPIFTLWSLAINFSGGTDRTGQVIQLARQVHI